MVHGILNMMVNIDQMHEYFQSSKILLQMKYLSTSYLLVPEKTCYLDSDINNVPDCLFAHIFHRRVILRYPNLNKLYLQLKPFTQF